MTGHFDIKRFGFKILQAAMIAAALVMVDSSAVWAGKKEDIAASYQGLEKIEVSQRTKDILNRLKEQGVKGAERLETRIGKVSDGTVDYFRYSQRAFTRQSIGLEKDILDTLDKLYKQGKITKEEHEYIAAEVNNMRVTGAERAAGTAKDMGKDLKAHRIELRNEKMSEVYEERTFQCKTSQQVRAEETAGCWSCLVFEKITSAFLYAAKAGIKVSQRAGVTLLILGTAIWLVLWALKNVSSFTEIQLGNILNELFKFLFKVGVAYWFISYGPSAISQYLIRPILSVGALVGQQFWDEDIKAYTEDWDYTSEADQKRLDEAVEKAIEDSKTTPVPKPSTTDDGLTEEERKQDEEAIKKNNEVFGESEIPNFLIPGVMEAGTVGSSYGCRKQPKQGASTTHKGIDVSVKDASKRCVAIVAAGPGTITYKYDSNDKTAKTGYGYYAMITYTAKDGNVWTTVYGHMEAGSGTKSSGSRVEQGEKIGCMGNTGVSTGYHLHFEVRVKGKINGQNFNGTVDPLSLPAGQLCSTNNMQCDGTGYKNCDSSILKKGQGFKAGGYPAAGKGIMKLLSTENSNTSSQYGTGGSTYTGYGTGGSTPILEDDDITYTGPADIIPGSIMNSMLGATRAITNTTAESKVVGRLIMCYSSLDNGGAIKLRFAGIKVATIPNAFMWIEGAIIWCFGFLLTMAIVYYLVDISFKIGFAVLAIPVVMGLWPFGISKDKLGVAISIIAKSAALFAFLAITTGFGMVLISNAGGFDAQFYADIDSFATLLPSDKGDDSLRETLNDKLYLFSPTFVLLLFTFLYVFKMVQKTSSDITNKFFPDKVFGNSSPMHSAATMMTSWAKKVGMNVTGINLVRDIAAHQTGRLARGTVKKVAGAVFHPAQTVRNIGQSAKNLGQKAKSAFTKKK